MNLHERQEWIGREVAAETERILGDERGAPDRFRAVGIAVLNAIERCDVQMLEDCLAWEFNPCGKPALDLATLQRFPLRPANHPHCLGVDISTEAALDPDTRAAVLHNLQGAYHHRRAFPGKLSGYFEGPHEGMYIIEIYGEGDPWPVLPEPVKPEFMR